MTEQTARRIGFAALLLAASQLLSRVLGFAREAAIAGLVGRGRATDAYNAAFQIPDILFYFLAGGALSIAFIPLYSRAKAERGDEAAQRFLATVLGTMTVVAVLLTAVLWIGADALVALQFPRFEPEAQALTTRLTRIVLPAQIFFIAGGIVRGALMAEGRSERRRSASAASHGARCSVPPPARSARRSTRRAGASGSASAWRPSIPSSASTSSSRCRSCSAPP
jgi:Na+-driven multidrug efflux pump